MRAAALLTYPHSPAARWLPGGIRPALTGALCVLALLAFQREAVAVGITSAVQRPFVQRVELQAEGNDAINEAKKDRQQLGALLSIGVRNDGSEPATLTQVTWQNRTLAEHLEDLNLVWHRLQPEQIPPRGEAVLTLCLRQPVTEETEFTLQWRDGTEAVARVPAEPPEARFEGICFEPGLKRLWIYVSGADTVESAALALFRNGGEVTDAVRWLSPRPVGAIRSGHLELADPVPRGATQVFRLEGIGAPLVTAVRAFDRPGIFGTYGRADFERQAFNGLNGYNSFGVVDPSGLDRAAQLGIRCAIMTGPNPPEKSFAHPALYAYVLTDEPDCKDYGVKDIPMGKRIGAHAPQMVEYARECIRQDPRTPTMLTVDLTFTPANYFYYGQVADIVNPDCYPVTIGWSVRVVRNYLSTVRDACAPRPFCYTYQGSWEEYAKKQPGGYVGGDTLRDKGWETFRDPEKVRGLGRAPDPGEVEIMMLYGIGCGAKGLFSYIDASELVGTLMFHGSEDLPEIWHTVGEVSRTLARLSPAIDISHPVDWATVNGEALWVKTLLAGDWGAVVVAVNEDFTCDKDAFRIDPAEDTRFVMPRLPWADKWRVARAGDGVWTQVETERREQDLAWHDTVQHGALYLLASRQDIDRLGQMDRERRTRRATALVQNRRDALRQERDRRMRVRDLERGPADTRLVGQPVNGYGITDRNLWNPQNEKHNGIEFWEREGTQPLGVQWTVTLGEERTQTPMQLVWHGRLYGGTVMVEVTGPDGQTIRQQALDGVRGTAIRKHDLTFPKPGTYRISLTVQPAQAREHGGRIARTAFLVKPSNE